MLSTITTVSEIAITYNPKIPVIHRPKIIKSQDAYNIFLEIFDPSNLTIKEESAVLFMNRANRVVGAYLLSSGGITGTVVDTRIILAIALKSLASGIMLAHTHPSGELKPSRQDLALTLKLKEGGQLLDISFMDHLIISTEGYFSFADDGIL